MENLTLTISSDAFANSANFIAVLSLENVNWKVIGTSSCYANYLHHPSIFILTLDIGKVVSLELELNLSTAHKYNFFITPIW